MPDFLFKIQPKCWKNAHNFEGSEIWSFILSRIKVDGICSGLRPILHPSFMEISCSFCVILQPTNKEIDTGKNPTSMPKTENKTNMNGIAHYYIKRCRISNFSITQNRKSSPSVCVYVSQIAVEMFHCFIFVVLSRSYTVRVNEDEWGHCPLFCLYWYLYYHVRPRAVIHSYLLWDVRGLTCTLGISSWGFMANKVVIWTLQLNQVTKAC